LTIKITPLFRQLRHWLLLALATRTIAEIGVRALGAVDFSLYQANVQVKGSVPFFLDHVYTDNLQITHQDFNMTARVLFSISDEVMAMFRSAVPARERSKTIERFMQEEVNRREAQRDQRIEKLAKMVETDPAYAGVCEVSESVDGVAGEAVE